MKYLRYLAVIGLVATSAAHAGEAGDLVFAERGPWDLSGGALIWTLEQTGPEVEGFKPLGEGTVTLDQVVDASDGKPVLQLAEDTARIKRKIGPFPVSGGDPTVTFFLETTTRDMAALTGGSPFYIRNRLKDALFRGGEVRHENGTAVAVFRPFADDKNKERMFGFETLELHFTIADPKAPIRRMAARTGPLAGDKPAYVSEMVLQ
ncbi:hypothetical protein [Paracoccus ravus]|uniref:hypothetical protein n=1 Tax=Paracoccus ravus TaxID=2447760 RepID=UPI00106E35DC|nr:hypothetical protein [Paracoccus ravus]